MDYTLAFSDVANGWTSFFSFKPNTMCKLNNRFFTIKDGDLWIHNNENSDLRNNFYGVQYTSKVVTIINDSSADDKIFKTLAFEGNKPWEAEIETNASPSYQTTKSTIKSTEFHNRESRWFAHVRKNEIKDDFHGLSKQGIGVIVSFVGNVLTFDQVPSLVNVGEELYRINGATQELIGTIIDKTEKTLTINNPTNLATGFYTYSAKNDRIEGSEIRGYYAKVSLENKDTSVVELYAIESNIIKSYV